MCFLFTKIRSQCNLLHFRSYYRPVSHSINYLTLKNLDEKWISRLTGLVSPSARSSARGPSYLTEAFEPPWDSFVASRVAKIKMCKITRTPNEMFGCQGSFSVPPVRSCHLYLSVLLDHPVSELGVVEQHLLLPHLLDGLVGVALQGVVVLVDLDAQAAAGGEVVWLGQVAQAVVLHRLTIMVSSVIIPGQWPLRSGHPPPGCTPCPSCVTSSP